MLSSSSRATIVTMASSAPKDLRTRVLVVDDDLKLCRLIRDYLEPMGYEVSAAHNGASGLQLALTEPFAALILDVMLPGMDGFEFLRRVRAESNTPVLMLTGRGEEADRIVGLELGADDYLPKTFSTRELLARLRAVIRRSAASSVQQADKEPEAIVVGDLQIIAPREAVLLSPSSCNPPSFSSERVRTKRKSRTTLKLIST